MNSARYVLTQVLDLIHRQAFDGLIKRYSLRTRHLGCRQQLICMGFARESLPDIEECLNAKAPAALYLNRWQIALLVALRSTLRVSEAVCLALLGSSAGSNSTCASSTSSTLRPTH